jgi:protein gp37
MMGSTSAIEWTEATWNPWRGCDKVSPGCAYCYMFTEQRRYGRDPSVVVRCSDSTFYAPLRSKRWREMPPGTHVFTCSWSDWFHEAADPWRDEAWSIVRERPDLIFQVLTKRPERIADHLPDDWGDGYSNVWLGVTIENRRFVHRADLLRETPAAARFISAEPLLGPLVNNAAKETTICDCGQGDPPEHEICLDCGDDSPGCRCFNLDLHEIDWLIAGGESGPRARPCREDWLRDLRDECEHAGTAFFLKQLGAVLARERGASGKGGEADATLDGRRHTAMPTSLVS